MVGESNPGTNTSSLVASAHARRSIDQTVFLPGRHWPVSALPGQWLTRTMRYLTRNHSAPARAAHTCRALRIVISRS